LPSASQPADIGVVGGKIAAIGAPGSLTAAGAARTVDAAHQIVVPGGVDPHIHCSSPIPFPGHNEDLLSAPDQVSRAALYGGTTTLLDFAPCPPDQPLQPSIALRQREWAGACYCDYGFHLLLHGKLSPGVLNPLPEAIQDGHASIKMFTTDIRPNRQGRMVQFGDIWEVLKILGKAGGIAAIHAEDNDIVMHMYEKLIREDRVGFENMAEVQIPCPRICR
jgi:dihydropyrimidinase